MTAHEKRDARAHRLALEALVGIGREIRQARLEHDLSQAAASEAIGKSDSAWSRLERGDAPDLPLVGLARAAAVVGLELSVRVYPGGAPMRDQAHLDLLDRFRAGLGAEARWQTEVPLPNPGDRRAWDGLIRLARVRIGVEAETRARDSQALQRRLTLKRRDGGVDHLILLLSNTRHNRRFLHAAGEGFRIDFPVPGRAALERLAASQDPGGSSIILM